MSETEESVKQAFAPVAKVETGVAKDTILVTLAAADAIEESLAKRGTPEAAIRVGVRGGGCSGYSYVIEVSDDPPRAGDTVLEQATSSGQQVRVFCDKKSILYLGGSVLDYERKLMERGFKFKNPHEETRCGCGESFTVAVRVS